MMVLLARSAYKRPGACMCPASMFKKLHKKIAESHKREYCLRLIIDYVCRPYLPPNPNPLPLDLEPENIERVVLVVERESWSIIRPSS